MKLKEIKPNTAVHCVTKEQVKYLVEHGYAKEFFLNAEIVPIWIGFAEGEWPARPTGNWMPEKHTNGETGKDYYKKEGYECVEFSDIIINRMKIKTMVWRLDNATEFDDAVNAALEDGWVLKKREVLQQGQPRVSGCYFSSMLYAELVKEVIDE